MGTRHYQKVIDKEGNVKVAQYGQWDGYPNSQGLEVLKFLKRVDLELYESKVSKLHKATQTDIGRINNFVDKIEKKRLEREDERLQLEENKEWWAFSRDCGSEIHDLIYTGQIDFVDFCTQEEADKWCEGFYTIDFSTNKFTAEFHGVVKDWDLDKLPTDEEFLNQMKQEEYYV